MPFTLAHPAVIIPLTRRLPQSALIAGTLAPDILHFIFLRPVHSEFTHSLLGMLITVPVAIVLVGLWHTTIEISLISLSPKKFLPVRPLINTRFVAAAAIGVATHLIWDAFTHGHGYAVERVPLLRLDLWPNMPMFFVLQVTCSVVGVAIVVRHGVRAFRRAAPATWVPSRYRSPRHPVLAATAILACTAAMAAYAAVDAMASVDEALRAEVAIVNGSVGATSGLTLALVIHGLVRRSLDGARFTNNERIRRISDSLGGLRD